MRYRLPPLNTLRIFEAVMRHGSIRQAAVELCLTPQAVSLQLKQLESYLGQQLFLRSSRSLTPTAAASRFHDYVRDGLDRFAMGVRAIQPAPTKQLFSLYVSPYFATEFLVPRLGQFTSMVPDIDVRMAIGVDLYEFESKNVEAAIHWSYGASQDFIETPLIDDLKVLVATPSLLASKPINEPRDLLKHSVVTPLVANSLWEDTLHLLGVQERPTHPVMMLHTHAAMMEAVLANLGVGFISYADAVREIDVGRLVAPFGTDLLQQLPAGHVPRFSLLVKPDRSHSPILPLFTRWLLDEVCTEEVVGYPSRCRQDQDDGHMVDIDGNEGN